MPKRPSPLPKKFDTALDQCGALCWRLRRGRIEVLLVTSRDSGRWIIPKGWPVKGLDHPGSAEREAWEEAGVTGQVQPDEIGHFFYNKALKPSVSVLCRMGVFPLRVTGLAKQFPEKGQRTRKWFAADKAAQKVSEPELQDLLANLVPGQGGLMVRRPTSSAPNTATLAASVVAEIASTPISRAPPLAPPQIQRNSVGPVGLAATVRRLLAQMRGTREKGRVQDDPL